MSIILVGIQIFRILFDSAAAYPSNQHQRILCGEYLNRELKKECNGTFNSMKKRSGWLNLNLNAIANIYLSLYIRLEIGDEMDTYTFYNELLGSLNNIRGRRNIIDECCRNPCTQETLRSYCAFD